MYLPSNIRILETDIIQMVLKLYLTEIIIKFEKFDSIENLRIISVWRNSTFDESLETLISS